jgi:hypothetical protein
MLLCDLPSTKIISGSRAGAYRTPPDPVFPPAALALDISRPALLSTGSGKVEQQIQASSN